MLTLLVGLSEQPGMRRSMLTASMAIVTLGCASAPAVEPIYVECGNLDLYRSLADLGAMMRIEDGCNGLPAAYTRSRWLSRYHPRQMRVLARLEREHGTAALEEADEIKIHPRCRGGNPSHY